MELTRDEWQALEGGQAVEVVVHGTRCVLLRHEIFDRVQRALAPSPRDVYPAIVKVLDQIDENPEQYLEYLNEPG